MLDHLRYWHREGGLAAIDWHFARLCSELIPDSPDEVLLAAALASRAAQQGHLCVGLNGLANQLLWSRGEAQIHAPELSSWVMQLQHSPLVGQPGDDKPLILSGGQGTHWRLYLLRYWRDEETVASSLIERSRQHDYLQPEQLQTALQGGDMAPGSERQHLARLLARMKNLCVISGGPGTGKTTVVASILQALQDASDSLPRIALAAPTGKAAARLQQSLGDTSGSDGRPREAMTLHRLLGFRSDTGHCRHHADNPLALDVLVIDECSMIDVPLMARLLRALPIDCRLILLGDRNQLASVQAGALLADICQHWQGYSPHISNLPGLPLDLPQQQPDDAGHPLADNIVLLNHSFRFAADSGIAKLASAVVDGEDEQALQVLQHSADDDLDWIVPATSTLKDHLSEACRGYFEALHEGADVVRLFQCLQGFRILCMSRHGAVGVEHINRSVEQVMQEAGLLQPRADWYHGQVLMVRRNDYELNLFNGDTGIVLQEPGSTRLRVWFQDPIRGEVAFSPERLPAHETVYAMTVHQSQGSEFDHVLLILDEPGSALLTREMLYTGVTRARQRCTLVASADAIRHACRTPVQRETGLADHLREIHHTTDTHL